MVKSGQGDYVKNPAVTDAEYEAAFDLMAQIDGLGQINIHNVVIGNDGIIWVVDPK